MECAVYMFVWRAGAVRREKKNHDSRSETAGEGPTTRDATHPQVPNINNLPPRSECLGFPPRHVCAAERCLLLTYLLTEHKQAFFIVPGARRSDSGFKHAVH